MTSRNVTWQTKLASGELCLRVKRCFGACHIMLPYLLTKQQVKLQGLDCWTYHTGLPRAQKSIEVGREFCFPDDREKIWQLSCPSLKVTVLATDIKSGLWRSVQVDQHTFQIKDNHNECRLMKNLGSSRFSLIQKAAIKQARGAASICNMDNKFIFLTGGYQTNTGLLSSVERYDIARDVWKEMPQLNDGRRQHGSCTQGTAVYVVCGYNDDFGMRNSIEKLETLRLEDGWQLIKMPRKSPLSPRYLVVVAALNENEILVMGGYGKRCLADGLTFDTRNHSVTRTVKEAPLRFHVTDVSSIQVRPGVVVALVKDFDDSRVKLIEYRQGSIRVLQ